MKFPKLLFLLGIVIIHVISMECLQVRGAYVETSHGGGLIGKVSESRNGKSFSEFLGIPFGKIPARFQISEAAEGWKGTRDATEYGPNCIQIDKTSGVISGQEDCLFLNVFKPEITFKLFRGNVTRKLPVIFAIHGGEFTMGQGASLRPDYLIDQDVIIVTPNYRLGPMGFLNAGVETARGNQGLKDLVLALQWVKLNIEKFGGDPDRVVIQGSASASYAVSYLTLSPMAKGLFSGAISQGGSALCPSANQFKPGKAISNARKLAQQLDCPSSNPKYLVKCLTRLDPKVILEQTMPSDLVHFDVNEPAFGPSLETFKNGDFDPNVFLSEDPYSVLQNGNFNRVPYIIGTDSQSGLIPSSYVLSNDKLTQRINTEWGRIAPNTFFYDDYALDPCVVSAEIREFYFDGGNISMENAGNLNLLYSDRLSYECTRKTALLYSQYASTYLYDFIWPETPALGDGQNSSRKTALEQPRIEYGVNRFLFPGSDGNEFIDRNSSDYVFSERFARLWTTFAKEGEPILRCQECNDRWSKFNPNEYPLKWFNIQDTPQVKAEDADFTSRMDFWNNLPLIETFNQEVQNFNRMSPTLDPVEVTMTTHDPIQTPTTAASTTGVSSPTKAKTTSLPPTSKPWSSTTNRSVSFNSTKTPTLVTIKYDSSTIRPSSTTTTKSSNFSANRPFSTIITTAVPSATTKYPSTSTSSGIPSSEMSVILESTREGYQRNLNQSELAQLTTLSRLQEMSIPSRDSTDLTTNLEMEVVPKSMSQTLEMDSNIKNATELTSNSEMMLVPIKMSQTFETEAAPNNATSKIKVSTHFTFNGTLVLSLLFPLSHLNTTQ